MIIIVDLDHTLIREDWTVSERTVKVFEKCKKNGHVVVVNSARSYLRSKPIADKIGADYVNCFYGNAVVDKNGKVLASRALKKDDLRLVVEEFQKIKKGWIGVEAIDGAYGTNEGVCKMFDGKFSTFDEAISKDALKLAVEFVDTPENREAAKKIADKFNLDVKFGREGFFCSLLPKNTDKWNGLKYILEKVGKNKKTIAFGDEISDLQTFKNVDIAVAMANSTPELLAHVDITTLSNEEDGVAVYLEKFL